MPGVGKAAAAQRRHDAGAFGPVQGWGLPGAGMFVGAQHHQGAEVCGLEEGWALPDMPMPERLRRLSGEPGAEGLRLLAACWRVGAERGGTLATVLDGLASALRAEEAQRQEVVTQLAGPRTTARMLALLPFLGLGMAAALGANPLGFLFGTLPGAGCLLLGVGLDLVGLWWTRRLARNAEALR